MTAPEVPVTQADRDAAADMLALRVKALVGGEQSWIASVMTPLRRGEQDHCVEAQALARHRAAAEAPHLARIAALEAENARLREVPWSSAEELAEWIETTRWAAFRGGARHDAISRLEAEALLSALAAPQRTEEA